MQRLGMASAVPVHVPCGLVRRGTLGVLWLSKGAGLVAGTLGVLYQRCRSKCPAVWFLTERADQECSQDHRDARRVMAGVGAILMEAVSVIT